MTASRRRTGQLIGRMSRPLFGIGGQVVNAGTNVATAYLASRVLVPAEFGRFALGFMLVTVVLAAGRGLIGATMQVHLPLIDRESRRREAVRAAIGFTLVVGVVTSLGAAATGDSVLLWFAPWILPALAQDAARYVFLSTGRTGSALLLDVAWALVQAAVLGAAALLGHPLDIATLSVAWGLGAAGGFALFALLHGAYPASPMRWLRTTRDVAGWFTGVAVVAQAELYLVLLLTGLMLGPVDAGGLRAVQLLAYQPILVLVGALVVLATPRMVRARSSRSAIAQAWLRGLGSTAPVLALLAVLALLHRPLMAVFFPQYVSFAPLVVPIALQGALTTLGLPSLVLLRALRRGLASLLLQAARAVIMVASAVSGLAVGAATGLVWGLVVGATVVLALTSVTAYRAAGRLEPDEPEEADQDAPTEALLLGRTAAGTRLVPMQLVHRNGPNASTASAPHRCGTVDDRAPRLNPDRATRGPLPRRGSAPPDDRVAPPRYR